MIKSIIHFSTKVILVLTVYVLMLIVGILSLVDALFRTLSDVIGSVHWVCLGFMLSAAVALTVYFLVDNTIAAEVWRKYSIIIMWLLVALMSFMLVAFGPLVTSLVQIVVLFVNPGNLSGIFATTSKVLSDWYMDLENGKAELWMSIISFPYIASECIGKVLGFVAHPIAWIGTPALFSWFAYTIFFLDSAAPAKGDSDYWICVVMCVLIGISGLFLGGTASRSLAGDTAEE